MHEIKKSFCRNCGAQCGVELEIEDGKILALRGDRQNPLSKGYFCIKGMASIERQNGLGRLTTAQKRAPDGFTPIVTELALDEIATQLLAISRRYGSGAVGLYYGTGVYGSSLAISFAKGFMSALGSPQLYSSQTIDQSPKMITALRMGAFKSGKQHFSSADVWLISGSNPLVSHLGGWGSNTMYAPGMDLRAARKRGLKLIVVDPRRTETARLADLHLQPRPGQDVALFSAILHIILSENLYDAEFCDRFAVNLEALRDQVRHYPPEVAAVAADVPAQDIYVAARLFAAGPRGCAVSGTGPNMAPHANLAEHLLECLNVVCGRYRRAGEPVINPSILSPGPVQEGVHAPYPIWDHSPKMASHPQTGWAIPCEYPTNLLADEILHEGENRLRALIVLGGNPVVAIPGYETVLRAFGALELLVTLDMQMSETAQLSHYVLSCKTSYERADLSLMTDGNSPVAAVQYTAPALSAPPGTLEEWAIFYGLAQRMGLVMRWGFWNFGAPGTGAVMQMDMETKPDEEDLFRFVCAHPEARFERIRDGAVAQVLTLSPRFVEPVAPDDAARLDLMPAEVAAEFADCRRTAQCQVLAAGEVLLHSRRLLEAMNSNYLDSKVTRERYPVNPLYMNPEDMAARGLVNGDAVEVATDYGRLSTIVRAEPTERPGAASMHHAWGRRFGPGGERQAVPVSVLIDRETCRENRNYVPRMSAIPVRITRAG